MARGRRTEYDPRRRVSREDWLRSQGHPLTMIDAVGNNAVRDVAAPGGQGTGSELGGSPVLLPNANILGGDIDDVEVVHRGLRPGEPSMVRDFADEDLNSRDLGTITLDEWKERERRNEGRGQ